MDPLCGGPCQGIRNSIPALATLQCENVVVCSDDPQSEFLQSDDFVIHALGKANGAWQKNAKLTPWLMHNLIHFDSVIIHGLWLHHSYATWKAVVRHRSFHNSSNPKLFLMSHGMLDPWFQRHPSRRLKAWRNWLYWKVIEKHVVNGVDGLLFTCEQELLLARETFPGYRPIREINVGYGVTEPPVRTPELDAAFRATTPELNGRPYLLFLSRIHPKKGVDLLLKAYASVLRNGTIERPLPETGRGEPNGMGELRSEVPDLVVAGPIDSEYARQMISMAQELGVSNRVHFPGMLGGDAKWGAFYGCEAFILPSHQENFGIAVAEALACSKPVLISNQVNISREIESSGAGFVAQDTEQGTIQLVERWCTMSSLEKESIGLKARACYREHFDIAVSTHRMAEALRA
jgi:glycosyltransferase involved in cell wall biosynthesis